MTLGELIVKASKEPSVNLTLGERLKTIRHLRGFKSQRQAAEKIGITTSALSNYESDRNLPDARCAIKIARVYNCSIDWLYGLTEEMGGKNDEHI